MASHKQRIKKLLKYCVLLLCVMVCLLAVFYGFLQTSWGKGLIASKVSVIVSDRLGQAVAVSEVHGLVPFNMHVGRVSIVENDSTWLVLENATINLSFWDLLGGNVHFRELGVENLVIDHLPEKKEKEAAFELPTLPQWLNIDRIAIDKLTLGEAVLGEAAELEIDGAYKPSQDGGSTIRLSVIRLDKETTEAHLELTAANERVELEAAIHDEALLPRLLKTDGPVDIELAGAGPADNWEGSLVADIGASRLAEVKFKKTGLKQYTFTMDGDIQLNHAVVPARIAEQFGNRAGLALRAVLTESGAVNIQDFTITTAAASLSVNGEYDIEQETVDITTELSHENLNTFLNKPDAPVLPVHARVQAEGPMKALALDVDGQVDGSQALTSKLTLTRDGDLNVSGDVALHPPGSLLPEKFFELLQSGVEADVNLTLTRENVLEIQTADITLDSATIKMTGRVVDQSSTMNLEGHVTVDDLQQFAQFIGKPISGSASGEFVIASNSDNATLQSTLVLENVVQENLSINETTISLSGESQGWPDQLFAEAQAHVTGHARGITVNDISGQELQLEARANSEDGEVLRFEQFDVASSLLNVNGTGQVNIVSGVADGHLSVNVPDLGTIANLFGQKYTGAVKLDIAIANEESDDGSTQTNASVEGILINPAGFPAPLDAAFGETASLNGRMRYSSSQLVIEELNVDGASVNLTASAGYILESKEIQGTVQLEIPNLASLDDELAAQLAGSLSATAEIAGPADNFQITGSLGLLSPRVNDFDAETATMTYTLNELPSQPKGAFSLRVQRADMDLKSDAGLAFAEGVVSVPEFSLKSGDNSAKGQGRYNPRSKTGQGGIDIDFPDLSFIGGLLGKSMQGKVRVNATLDEQDGVAVLDATGTLKGFRLEQTSIENASLTATLRQPFTMPEGMASLKATSLEQGKLRVTSVAFEAAGDREIMQVSATAEGRLPSEALFSTAMKGNLTQETGQFELLQFEGDLEDTAYALTAPAKFGFGDSTYSLSPLRIDVDEGHLSAQGLVTEESASASVNWEAIPASVAEVIGAPALSGHVNGELSVSGTPEFPSVVASLTVNDFRMVSAVENVAPASMTAEAELTNGRMSLAAKVTTPDALELEIDARAPAEFRLMPFKLNLPENGALNGTVRAQADLESIPRMLGNEEHVLAGTAEAGFVLSGTIGLPRLDGEANVRDGRYENTKNGTILDQVAAVFTARNSDLELTELSATDGQEGSIQAQGKIRLVPADHFPFDLTATLSDAWVIRRDSLTLRTGGKVNIAGNLKEAMASGDVTLGLMNMTLQESKNPDFAQLVVHEVNGPGQMALASEDSEGAHQPLVMNLDIAAEIPGRAFVRGRGLESEWQGNLKIAGHTKDLRIGGTLELVRGYLDFMGRRFDLERGTITLDIERPPSPYINAVATAERGDMTARLELTGTLEQMDLLMSSEPPLPQDEILAKLLFGRSVSDISPAQAIQLARAAGTLSGKVKGLPFLSGPGRLPFETFDIRQGDTAGEYTLGLGKYLSEDVYVEIEQGTGDESSRVSVEIELGPEVEIKAEVGADTRSGIGIFWEKDY